jgi:hypothetical protein
VLKEQITLVEELFEKIKILGQSTIELVKLRFYRKFADVIALSLSHLLIGLIFALMLLFFHIALAFWLGELLGEIYFGFLIIGIFYGILGLLLVLFYRKALLTYLHKYIVKHLF